MEFDENNEEQELEEIGIHLPAGNYGGRKVGGSGGYGYRYRECLKNHAVSIGGNAVDGCGEFMAAGEEGTLDALKCAACNCHRNFHRKEMEGGQYYHRPAGHLHVVTAGTQHRAPLALPATSREDQEDHMSNPSSSGGGGGSKKRFRTKFTQEQKDKMLVFAESVGWRIQKQDEGAVQQFCAETGVKRHVLKVWMHNNKHTIGKKA